MDLYSIFGPMFKVPVPPAPTGASTAADPLNKVTTTKAATPVQSKKNLYIGIAVALLVLILMLGGGYFMSSTKNGSSRGDVK
jgi:hypothetical protein